ncbi:alternative ribosome rescue aminoacyl-tRNA hydrolase ArfB [Winogradskyella marincola]|uniref:Alternative ribosome rescue aminoacyl-tRNA hydrolase ArfB n=1 Tax=Winogradskyella marincola TaxID=3037795 RepID=A0ABT6G208_9FLAO|nr:alternative ribosome rescue aminoacyl-tRNA hydrolase ArfB [Winogradskyella sp. YYF002]MDG4715995.1 alternative ribosome rescue aminoacyl-tRNA hydrolase ArfB [Winogradskyella sp. YYF002]
MDVEALKSELMYKAVRSSGSGGQHVNKVASKVVLYFNVEASAQFTDDEKARLTEFFQNRLNKQGVLVMDCSESRSQFRNKALVTQKFLDLIIEGLKEEKERKPTKVPKAVKRKRLDTKRKNAEKKANRKPPKID